MIRNNVGNNIKNNLLGQIIKTSEESSIALSDLPVGVYVVSIATKNGRFSKTTIFILKQGIAK